jgi:hypothetical protein
MIEIFVLALNNSIIHPIPYQCYTHTLINFPSIMILVNVCQNFALPHGGGKVKSKMGQSKLIGR